MFLFLSKLLPIFVYPLGLACVLLLAALVLLWKKPRWAAVTILVALLLLVLGSSGPVTASLMRNLEWQYLPQGPLPNAEAIVVLGGSTSSADPPRPWVEVSDAGDRILYAAKLYREGKAPKLILSGGRIRWQGVGPSEAADMATLLEAMGIPASALIQEPSSLNTYENAVNVKKILDERNIRRVLLVTSALHMPRSMLIFKRLGIDAIAAPTDFHITQAQSPEEADTSGEANLLGLLPDADRLRFTTRALKEYIGLVVYRLRGWL